MGFSRAPNDAVKACIYFAAHNLACLAWLHVLAVADAVGSVAVGTVGLAADAAIGTVRLGGKAVGVVAGAAMPNSEEKKK